MNIGIALSGGGARGISHIGVLQALNEHGIFPSRISGTSAGAIVGALYAAGKEPKEILEILGKVNVWKYLRPAVSWKGLIKIEKLEELLIEHLPDNSFESLNLPLSVAATDIIKGKTVFFDKGELIKPIIASSSIPFVFDTTMIDGRPYVDGGVLNNLPIEPLKKTTDFVIGVNCNHQGKVKAISGFKNILERSLLLSINQNVMLRKRRCDLFIDPPQLQEYKIFHINKAKELYEIGYQFTLKKLSKHKKLNALFTEIK